MKTVNSPETELKRAVLATFLWEDQFYVNGVDNATLISQLVDEVSPEFVSALAVEARTKHNLRKVPLYLLRLLAAQGKLKAETLVEVIQRPDEIGAFLELYWKDNASAPLSNQVKRGLARCFNKFNEYQLAKWDKNSAKVSLRDAMRLVHPKPESATQAEIFQKLSNNALATPDTWETQLSAGANKREVFTRLLEQKKLGALAFLRNLRNMQTSGVDSNLIVDYSRTVNTDRVLPFRFITARGNGFDAMLNSMMLRSLENHDKLSGKTILLIDVSGSMFHSKVSQKSDLDRFDAAAALAMLCREVCEEVEVYTFSDRLVPVDVRNLHGFMLVNALKYSQANRGTDLTYALSTLSQSISHTGAERLILFTDEQSTSRNVPNKNVLRNVKNKYSVNVAGYSRSSLDFNEWLSITGFSESVIKFIYELEQAE